MGSSAVPVSWAAWFARLARIARFARPARPKMNQAARNWIARGITVVAILMLAAAGWLFAYPFYTDVRAGNLQGALRTEFASVRFKSDYQQRTIAEGDPLTRIVIPSIGLDAVVVEGTSPRALAAGMGHYLNTPLPGETGNVAIAGHRTMNGRAFGNLDRLRPGNRIELITPLGRHVYELDHNPWVAAANDWSVIDQTPERWLTLTTCHPRGSSKQRLVARASWISSEVRT